MNSDNGSISKKILLESELLVTQNVDIGVAYSCLKYGVFNMNRFDLGRLCIQLCECSWPEYLHFDPFLFGCRISKGCSMFTWILISTVVYVV